MVHQNASEPLYPQYFSILQILISQSEHHHSSCPWLRPCYLLQYFPLHKYGHIEAMGQSLTTTLTFNYTMADGTLLRQRTWFYNSC